MNNNDIINLFRKVIASLSSIEIITNSDKIKFDSKKYLDNIVKAYNAFIQKKDLKMINIKELQEDIDVFSYECINDKTSDLVILAEDLKYGFDDLCNIIKRGNY